MKDREAIDILVRKRPKQHAIDNTEDNGGCADAKGEGEDGDYGEARVFAEGAEGVAEVVEEIVELSLPMGVADIFFNAFQSAEFLEGPASGFFWSHTLGDVVGDLSVKMEA